MESSPKMSLDLDGSRRKKLPEKIKMRGFYGVKTWVLNGHWGKPVADGLYFLRVKVTLEATSATRIFKILVLR